MTTLTLSIAGMTCGHCLAAVTKTLERLDGVELEDVRIGSARVRIDESKVTPDAVAQAVTDEGYATIVRAA